ncbi:hypothetical protein [Actinomyces faecalis]|uniref:hypothetical protein n=1 Tax=Actinomyces faecalis TaxID=2722820 RepID=UPI0015559185|nr:hypothetical protein [Actinomyces faecalis]
MTFADPVSLVRAAVTGTTGMETTRVLDVEFTSGPVPVVHVHHLSGTADEVDRLDQVGVDVYHTAATGPGSSSALLVASRVRDALVGTNLPTPVGLIDEVAVSAEPVTRPYAGLIEVASMVLDVTHRPIY